VTPWELGHFNLQDDNFPTLGPTFIVKFPSLLEAFLNDFSIIFQNDRQKVIIIKTPSLVEHFENKLPRVAPPPPILG